MRLCFPKDINSRRLSCGRQRRRCLDSFCHLSNLKAVLLLPAAANWTALLWFWSWFNSCLKLIISNHSHPRGSGSSICCQAVLRSLRQGLGRWSWWLLPFPPRPAQLTTVKHPYQCGSVGSVWLLLLSQSIVKRNSGNIKR